MKRWKASRYWLACVGNPGATCQMTASDEPQPPARYSRIGLDVTLTSARLAADRLADQASQDAAREAAISEDLATEAAEAGRRRRELADLDELAADEPSAEAEVSLDA